jgi:hypothetical protein
VEGLTVHFIQLLLAVTATLFTAACSRAEWPVTRELCGRIQVAGDQSRTILKNTDLVLYRSRSKRIRCCSEADRIANIQTNADGKFDSGRLDAGRYFVVVKSSPQIVFPVYLETHYDGGKCSMDPVFSFDRRTGRTELTETILIHDR